MKTTHCLINDALLFLHIKNVDQAAFRELYNRYWAPLLDMAYKPLQCRDKAEGIVQAIFISLYQRCRTVDLEASLKACLCKALKFKVLNEVRSRAVRETYQRNFLIGSICKNDFVNHCETKELKKLLRNWLTGYPKNADRLTC